MLRIERPNNFVQETPVCAILFVISQMPGVPDDNRSLPASHPVPLVAAKANW